jgi:integrase
MPGRVTGGEENASPGELTESFDIRFRQLRSYKGARGQTYTVRWTVGGRTRPETFKTKALAEARLAELRTYARNGVPFDVATGLPAPELRKVRAEAVKAADLSWYRHALNYLARRRKGLAGNSVRSVAETLATVTPALLVPGEGRPDDSTLRDALYRWAFRDRHDTPEEVAAVLRWVAGHSRPLTDLADPDVMLDVLDAIASRLDGTPAAANTVARKRAVLSNVLDYGVGRGLDANPLPLAAKMWTSPRTTEGAVDPRVVVNRRQAEELLTAVSYQKRVGPRLVAFFACLYYAGTRPSEAVELREHDNLDLPDDDGWGTLYLHGSAPTVGAGFSRSGRRRDPRELKHRGRGEVRPVPCHPALTRYLRWHISQFGTASDGRLFRGERGGDLSESVYQRAWQGARLLALPPGLAASPLAGRPYDLRHACLSTWLNAGVDPTQVAEWAGNTVEVLMRVYAKCIHGRDELNRRRIEDALRYDVGATGTGETSPRIRPGQP